MRVRQSRAAVVKEMEAAIAASYAGDGCPGFQALPPGLIGWLEHQGEHYGKLVTSYRVNGVVPPVSRPKSVETGNRDQGSGIRDQRSFPDP